MLFTWRAFSASSRFARSAFRAACSAASFAARPSSSRLRAASLSRSSSADRLSREALNILMKRLPSTASGDCSAHSASAGLRSCT